MDEKVSFVVDSIRKLLALKVSDEEIIAELNGVGIGKEEAIGLIEQAKNNEDQMKKENTSAQEETSSQVYDEVSSKLSMDDQVVSQLGLKESQAKKTESSTVEIKTKQNDSPKKEVPVVENISPEQVDFGLRIKGNSVTKQEAPKNVSQTVEKKIINPQVVSTTQKSYSEQLNESLQNFSSKSKNQNVSNNQNNLNTQSTQNQQKSAQSYSSNILNSNYNPINSSTVSSQVSQSASTEMDALWKKGIVVAVNSKLLEMKKLKEEVDVNIQEKVDASVRKEVAQLRVLLDSQRDLLIASNKAALEEKQKEVSFIIDSKIVELKQANKQLATNLSALEAAKQEQQVSLEQIKQMLEEARRVKAQLLVEMNSELIKSKSQAQAFLDNADKHLKDLDERINRTLELQRNIADGMIQQAEQKIESLTLQKTDELVNDLEVRLNKLKVVESEVNPEILMQKVKMLDDFKKQFIETMKDNIAQINVAIEELNKKNVSLDMDIQQKMLVIDAKIEELTKFEKDFTMMMNNSIDKL